MLDCLFTSVWQGCDGGGRPQPSGLLSPAPRAAMLTPGLRTRITEVLGKVSAQASRHCSGMRPRPLRSRVAWAVGAWLASTPPSSSPVCVRGRQPLLVSFCLGIELESLRLYLSPTSLTPWTSVKCLLCVRKRLGRATFTPLRAASTQRILSASLSHT